MTTSKTTQKTSTQSPTTPAPTAAPAPVAQAQPAAPPPTPAPDPNAALAALVAQAITQLDAIEASLGTDPPLSATEKRHAARMRKGGQQVITTIGTLATQNDLESRALQVAPMTTDVGQATALQPLANRLAPLVQHVNDLIFTAQSSAWESAMQFYALLQRRAVSDGQLAKALQPVTQFFAARHKTVKAPGTPTKPQKKATTKALKTLTKNAPALLAQGTTVEPAAPAPVTPAPAATPATPKA
jgi:hypothetical protein